MNTNYQIVEQIKDNELKSATNEILKAMSATVRCYLTIGEQLHSINVNKLYKNDFNTFDDYVNQTFGISKATAYRMINVTKKFLVPELPLSDADKIFSPFEDTALAALNPVGDYDTTVDFIHDNNITPETPVSEIRKIVKSLQDDRCDAEGAEDVEDAEETTQKKEINADDLETTLATFNTAMRILLDDMRHKAKSKWRKVPLRQIKNSLNEFDVLKTLIN